MSSCRTWKRTSILTLCAAALSVPMYRPATAQAPKPLEGSSGSLPKVIISCFYYPPPSKAKLCANWIRQANTTQYAAIPGGSLGLLTVERFGAGSAVLKDGLGYTYSGKIGGNHIQGTRNSGRCELWSYLFGGSEAGRGRTGRHPTHHVG